MILYYVPLRIRRHNSSSSSTIRVLWLCYYSWAEIRRWMLERGGCDQVLGERIVRYVYEMKITIVTVEWIVCRVLCCKVYMFLGTVVEFFLVWGVGIVKGVEVWLRKRTTWKWHVGFSHSDKWWKIDTVRKSFCSEL